MPEIAEVARITHFLRLNLVGKTIKKVVAVDDANVFGKVGTSGKAVEDALKGKKVVGAGSQGKYFWLILDKPPHPVMHFGMTGWVHIRNEQTAYTNYYKKLKPEDLEQWPPKFWKFHLATTDSPPVEIAFTDARRFGRVRLVDCPGADIRSHSPLVENGPDPVVDHPARFTEAYLRGRMRARHVPIKALLLDQAVISGIGNWVGDEVLYHARLHPEQYSDDFSDTEVKKLFESIRFVCQTAVDKLGDSDEFPKDWLFDHRWGKGSKGAGSRLPNGEKLAFLTVGGRTSCYAPGLQKKTGRVVPGVKEEPMASDGEEVENSKVKGKGKKGKKQVESEKAAAPAPQKRKQPTKAAVEDADTKPKRLKAAKMEEKETKPLANGEANGSRRRSGRIKALAT